MMTITLPEDIEIRLKNEAARRGLNAIDFAVQVLSDELAKPSVKDPTITLMRRLMEEDTTSDPEELALREKEGEDFMHSLAQTRIEMEGPNARKLWP